MSDNIQIIVPKGMFGASEHDNVIDQFLRKFAVKYSTEKGEWAEKYGTNFSNEKVIMKPFCWCDKLDCPYCFDDERDIPDKWITEFGVEKDGDGDLLAPNFWYKPLDLKIWWYKYIGRSVSMNKKLSQSELEKMIDDCFSNSFNS